MKIIWLLQKDIQISTTEMIFHNKAAVITGGCGAIGLAVARELLKRGISVSGLINLV